MNAKAHVFDCTACKKPEDRPVEINPPLEVVAESQDAAKEGLRGMLVKKGYSVRSVSWGPGTRRGDPDRLVAYVVKVS